MNDLLGNILGAPVHLEELKHRPGRRRTLRARGSKGTAIVKVYASKRAAVVARRLAALSAGPAEPVVPSVVHLDEPRHLVVLTDIAGDPFREALLDDDRAACARVGTALGTWHAAWRDRAPEALQPHTAEQEVSILRERAASASAAVARAVEDALPHLSGPWDPTTVVHRDLYEEQILVHDRIGLIDLDDAALGPHELDIGNLIAHVELLELRRRRDLAEGTRAFLDAYAGAGPTLDVALLERCRRLTLLRLACLNDDIGLARSALVDRVSA